MVKLRQAYYCNLKLFLIFLVVWGHLIEPRIWTDSAAMTLYRWIYVVHMPLFAFVSGLFVTNSRSCVRQLQKAALLYVICQTAAALLGGGSLRWDRPFWHLWYLLSLCCWLGLGWLWLRFGKEALRWVVFSVSILAGLAAGFVPWIGRVWSLSRTVVFFPWFFLGLVLTPELDWYQLRPVSPMLLAAALYLERTVPVNPVFLYQAAPYSDAAQVFLRLRCYILALLVGLLILSWCPRRRLRCSWLGADTMAVYLLHAPLVLALRELVTRHSVLWSVAVILAIRLPLRWHSVPCGIIPGERRVPHGRFPIHIRTARKSRLPLFTDTDRR